VVLIRTVVLGMVLVAGCSESLFGLHRGSPAGDGSIADDGSVAGDDSGSGDPPGSCTGSCISDAAAAFDGSSTGIGNYWRYFEDRRNRTWLAMTPGATSMTGADARNQITTCAARPDAATCKTIPGALLVSAAGPSSSADPAIAFVVSTSQSVELRLRVASSEGGPTIRLYRNSREDVLFTAIVAAGVTVDQAIMLDALAGDRFLVAVIPPTDDGATDVGLDLTVRASGVFPTSCQLAVDFETINGNNVPVSCMSAMFMQRDAQKPSKPMQSAAPFAELQHALRIPESTSLEVRSSTATIDYTNDVTLQLWVHQEVLSTAPVWVFSDLDFTAGGGLSISILPGLVPMLDVATGTSAAPRVVRVSAPYSAPASWHFIRVVRSRTELRVCMDGEHAMTIDAPAALAASAAANLGKDVLDPPEAALFDGSVDDLRAITGALPCEPAP
jgi:hypothetical protein